jgi:hypothetical protein
MDKEFKQTYEGMLLETPQAEIEMNSQGLVTDISIIEPIRHTDLKRLIGDLHKQVIRGNIDNLI